MAITAPIAGAYTGTWGGDALNYTRSGFNLHFRQKGQRIEETDIYGMSLIDIIYLGAQLSIDCICRVYTANSRDFLFPWTAAFGQVYNASVPIASLASQLEFNDLVLTVVANTPAANGAGPNTLTADPATLSPDQDLTVVLSSTIRDVPLAWDVLTTQNSSTGLLFTVT